VRNVLRRIRGAIGMGITWAVGWAVFGILIGVSSRLLPGLPWDSFFEFFDAPLPALAVPGFVGGALFSVVLGIAGRHRRFSELSIPRFAAWGALGGLLLSLVPGSMAILGLATFREGLGIWQLTSMIGAPLILLSAGSAAGSLALARKSQHRELLGGSPGIAQVGSGDSDTSFMASAAARKAAARRSQQKSL
jgi:hypothetical protein